MQAAKSNLIHSPALALPVTHHPELVGQGPCIVSQQSLAPCVITAPSRTTAPAAQFFAVLLRTGRASIGIRANGIFGVADQRCEDALDVTDADYLDARGILGIDFDQPAALR